MVGFYNLARSKTETRSLGAFTSIEFVGGNGHLQGQLDLRQGAQKVDVMADCDEIANITTTVAGTRLVIDASRLTGQGVPPSFTITLPILEELVVTACSCNLYDFSGTSLSCQVNSGSVNSNSANVIYDKVALGTYNGNMGLQLVASTLSCKLTGTGDILLGGSADSAVFFVGGRGGVNPDTYFSYIDSPFTTANATVDISGSGSILLRATNTLNATITGSGNINYWGNPTVTQHITGTGLLIKKD